MRLRLLASLLVVCALCATPAASQDHSAVSGATTIDGHPVASDATLADDHAPPPAPPPSIDVGDLWRMIRHHEPSAQDASSSRRYLVVAPSIGSKPSTGLSGGFSSNVAFFDGPSASTHISTLSGGLKVTQKEQVMFGSRLALFTPGDRWFILADNRVSWTSQSTYALGDAPASSAVGLKFDVLKFYESAYREVGPGLFVGGGLNINSHYSVQPGASTSLARWDNSAYVAYSREHHLSPTRQDSAGASVGIRYDTRDNGINANQGWLAATTFRTFFDGFMGGDSTWQELAFDVRTYRKLTPDGQHKLAFWFMGDLVTGGTAPFWDLPATATDGRSARGYGEGRYRGEQLLYWESEYRATLTQNGLLGMVLFANLSTVGSAEARTSLFSSFAPGVGFGFRVRLNKRSRTNLCTDWGWGKQGSHGFYLSIQEAF